MIRSLIACCLSLLLTACWGSETRLFAGSDWTRPAGLEGKFIIENADGKPEGKLVLVPRADGMIDGTATRNDEPAPKTSPVGFVAIPGGSGHYFVMVQQMAPDKGGELYFIAHWQNDRLDGYWPECKGTPDLAGMRRDKPEFMPEAICVFTSKQAVLRAALAAERELTGARIFPAQKVGRLRRATGSDASEPASPADEPTD